jgi:D-alanine-D-alanine ligase
VEKFVQGMEATVAVLDGKALPVVEIVPKSDFYNFENRYTPGRSEHIIPARVPAVQAAQAKKSSVLAGKALGCDSYYRVDLIIPKKGKPQVLEVNTAPGMTSTSLFPDAARAVGITFPALLKRLVRQALSKRVLG